MNKYLNLQRSVANLNSIILINLKIGGEDL